MKKCETGVTILSRGLGAACVRRFFWFIGFIIFLVCAVLVYWWCFDPDESEPEPTQGIQVAHPEGMPCPPLKDSEMEALIAPKPNLERDGDWYQLAEPMKLDVAEFRPEWWANYKEGLRSSILLFYDYTQMNIYGLEFCEGVLGGPIPEAEAFAARYEPVLDCHIRELGAALDDWLDKQQFMHDYDPFLAPYFPTRQVALTRLGLISVARWKWILMEPLTSPIKTSGLGVEGIESFRASRIHQLFYLFEKGSKALMQASVYPGDPWPFFFDLVTDVWRKKWLDSEAERSMEDVMRFSRLETEASIAWLSRKRG